jgi:hypothetical protein
MVAKLTAVAMIFCMMSPAGAGTPVIGTVSVRGDMRVDGYNVKGDATLFDGSVVETRQDSALLRLDKGVEIKLSTDSRGVLHRSGMVLQQGKSEWVPAGSFSLEANGLQVTSNEPNSRGVISVGGPKTVEVAALTGGFSVTNDHGALLARVRPGHSLSFDIQQAGASSLFIASGVISVEGSLYFLTVNGTSAKYEVIGKDFEKLIGKTVTINGKIELNSAPPSGAVGIIDVSSVKRGAAAEETGGGNSSEGTSGGGAKKVIIFATIIGATLGTAIAIAETNNSPSVASPN